MKKGFNKLVMYIGEIQNADLETQRTQYHICCLKVKELEKHCTVLAPCLQHYVTWPATTGLLPLLLRAQPFDAIFVDATDPGFWPVSGDELYPVFTETEELLEWLEK